MDSHIYRTYDMHVILAPEQLLPLRAGCCQNHGVAQQRDDHRYCDCGVRSVVFICSGQSAANGGESVAKGAALVLISDASLVRGLFNPLVHISTTTILYIRVNKKAISILDSVVHTSDERQ